MSKGLKVAIVMVVIIALFAVGIIFLLKDNGNVETPQDESKTKIEYLLQINPEDMQNIKINNKTDTYNVECVDGILQIDAFDNKLVDYEYLIMLYQETSSVQIEEVVQESLDNLKTYGLDDPITVEVSTFSGETHKLYVGNQEPISKGRYAYLEGDNRVVLLPNSKTVRYAMDIKRYVSIIVIPPETSQDPLTELKYLKLSGENLEEEIEIQIAESDEMKTEAQAFGSTTHIMTKPDVNEVDATTLSTLVDQLFGLLREEVVAINQTESKLANFGFDNPLVRYQFVKENEGELVLYDLKIIKKDSGTYATLNEDGVIYKISDLDFANFTYEDLILRWPLSPFFMSVSGVNVEYQNKDYQFDINFIDNNNVTITCDGNQIDETLYRKYHTLLVSLEAEGMMTSDWKRGEKLMQITFSYADENKSDDTLELYDIGKGRIEIVKNGISWQYSLSSYTDCVRNATANILEGNPFETEWN